MIETHIKEALDRYVKDRIPPGDFLTAVLKNDLTEACGRADVFNRVNLHMIVEYAYNFMPSACWGSPEKVKAWLSTRNEEDLK